MNRVSVRRLPGYALVVALGTAMAVVSELLHTTTLLFPEGVALAAGAWVLRRRDWTGSPTRLVLAVVPCSLLGVLAVRVVGHNLAAQLLALVGAALLLYLLSAPVGPALSAAMLPTVFGIGSWRYPAAVLVISTVVVAGAVFGRRNARPDRGTSATRWPALPLIGAGAVGALWLSTVYAFGLPTVAAAPPLLVSLVELVFGPSVSAGQLARRASALTAAWTVGAALAWWLPLAWTAVFLALVAAMASIAATRAIHPPVLAMSMVAQVSGAPNSWTQLGRGAAAVAAAVAILYLLGARLVRPLSARPPRRTIGFPAAPEVPASTSHSTARHTTST